jgi:hypothetical protein
LNGAKRDNRSAEGIAQQRNLLGDATALGEVGALAMMQNEAFNRNDAGAAAALFTEDAVLLR